uniref:Uncharacterized protein n=1 Tax=Catharus ustulatus TaxID=91951 RepID=A0A8C3UR87_CATUS
VPGSGWPWLRRWAWPGLRCAQVSPGVPRCVPRCPQVTQVCSRIGLAVAEALGVAGAQVFLSSRRQHNVDRAVAHLRGRGLQVSGVTCHVGRAEERERMVQAVRALDTFGAIDILVSNAAVNPHLGPALEADESTWDKVRQDTPTWTRPPDHAHLDTPTKKTLKKKFKIFLKRGKISGNFP